MEYDSIHGIVKGVLTAKERLGFLKNFLIFSQLPSDALEEIAGVLAEEHFAKDAIVIKEGELGNKLYLIAQGKAEVITASENGPVILAVLAQGEMFGELALLSPTHERKATVRAVTPLKTLTLDQTTFDQLIAKSPNIKKT